jgi:prepilin-type N-terminal cleavage/methylation domain-containing protein
MFQPISQRLRTAGYTLLELLVVMLIFGLLAGITTPRLLALYDSSQLAAQRDEIIAQVARLNYLAFQQGLSFDLSVYPPPADRVAPPLDLPQSWSLSAPVPIQYYSNGACSGGILELRRAQQVFVLELSPPLCQPKRLLK